VTVRDYFRHSLEHPDLQPYVYFTPGSDLENNDLWVDIPSSCYVDKLQPEQFDILFIGAWDRRFLARKADLEHPCVINAILHVRHAKIWKLRRYLRRPAFRLCNSPDVKIAIEPYANGPVEVIPNGIDDSLFFEEPKTRDAPIVIWGSKNPGFAKALAATLEEEGIPTLLLIESRPRAEFAALLRRCRVFIAVPNRTEGFYRPALEAMACGSAVICPDVVGNRCYSADGENCIQPPFEDQGAYVEAVRLLSANTDVRARLRTNGLLTSQKFSIEEHRNGYYRFLENHIL